MIYAAPNNITGPTVIDKDQFDKALKDPKIIKLYQDAEDKYGHIMDKALTINE